MSRLINVGNRLARFAFANVVVKKLTLNYKINQRQCDFLMLHCCSNTHKYSPTHTNGSKDAKKNKNSLEKAMQAATRKSCRYLFFVQIDVVFDSWKLQQKLRQINK